ncbi:COMM domain-containing 3 [Brachionus plicatilis]|uniref:COMM domain-containing protein 3 n=1 Tax=Brachionus plicatilis TaxID=10195 RepID=A0A3M7P0V6_BRAPC|nr:COMM domain-containing 3 [Brachionus plicatilis]
MARHNLDSNLVSNFLEDIGFSNEKIGIFTQYYQEKLEIIRLFLASSTTSFPHIVDVNWRLDYIIKENNLERINEPVYLIELKIEKPGETNLSKIQFSCTVEQLQDLVFKLKEASKSVERLAQI